MKNSAFIKEQTTSVNLVAKSLPGERVASVDVYRGFVMLLMMGEVLSFSTVSQALPDSAFWQFMSFHQSHVPWTGLALHDMIQPSFTFIVGVVLPFSLASRKNKGDNFRGLLMHTLKRSLILILLGIFLRSIDASQTYFTFEDTLTQIGLGYTFLVLLGFCSKKTKIIFLVAILFSYWLLFALYPLPGSNFDYAAAGVSPDWEHNLQGFAAHWNKNVHPAWVFDRWFLNLFPRETPFANSPGGYSTLSFIPTLGTMIIGSLAGDILYTANSQKEKLKYFIFMGVSLIAVGVLLHVSGINPIVKRIWTPAWTVFSGGICFLFLAVFYRVIDMSGKKKWFFFLTVIGANSIAAYFLSDSAIRPFIKQTLYIHLGKNFDKVFGSPYAILVSGGITLFILWLILYWMYKRKIFIKI